MLFHNKNIEYFVDKFNRRFKPSATPIISAGGAGTGMSLETDGWNAKRRKIIIIERGVKGGGEAITFDQTITHTASHTMGKSICL